MKNRTTKYVARKTDGYATRQGLTAAFRGRVTARTGTSRDGFIAHAGFAIVATFLAAGVARGAPEIRQSIRTSDRAPSGAPDQLIQEYIEYSFEELISGKGRDVRAACDALTEPLHSVGSRIFKKAYSTMLTGYFQKALREGNVLVRINAMIAVKYLTDKSAVTLIGTGLTDDCPAVRLHAGRAVSKFANQNRLDDEDQGTVLKGLKEASEIEPFQRVLEQMLEALAALTIRDASRVLLDAINGRVADHDANPNLPIRPEFDALTRQFRRYVNAGITQPEAVPDDWTRHLTLVAYRYLCVSVKGFPRLNSTPGREEHKRMIKLCHTILQKTAPRVVAADANVKVNPPAALAIKGDEASWVIQAQLRCAEWEALLTKLGFTAGQLAIPGGNEGSNNNGAVRSIST